MSDFERFVGKMATAEDIADPQRILRLAAALDHDDPPWKEETLPPLGHWLCFQPKAPQSFIGTDGHERRTDDGLLPVVDFPRRMWVGSRIDFIADIPLGTRLQRKSTLIAVTPKEGRSGRMLFVSLLHEIGSEDGIAILEEQDIVYREASKPGVIQPRHYGKDCRDELRRTIVPDPVLLFRYSALTFNGHRIHYDRDYCRNEEGYPNLVVHGPLIATLLLDHALRHSPKARVTEFVFRAEAPSFEGEAITLGLTRSEGGMRLNASNPFGLAVSACVGFAD